MQSPTLWLLRALVFAALVLGSSACRGPDTGIQESPSASPTSISLLDQQLIKVIQMEKELSEMAAQPNADHAEIYRFFQQVAQEYRSIISRNPRNLESRLLFGKLLSAYGDSEGARDQFLLAAGIDSNVAVIHQQLSTYYAEEADHTRALAYALNAIRIEPETAAYHYGLGQVLAAFRENFIEDEVFSAEQIDRDLLDAFHTAMKLEPDSIPLQFRFGEAFYDVGNPDWQMALQHWQQMQFQANLSQLEKDAVLLHQARCFLELGQPDAARRITQAIESPQLQQSARSLF